MDHATHGSGGRTRHVKGIVLGALLIPVNLQWQMQTETVTGVFVFSVFAIFFNCVFILFVLAVLNAGLTRLAPRVALSPTDLLVAYVMLTIGSGIFGHDLMLVMVTHIAGFWFATPENEFVTLFARHLPGWLSVHDGNALNAYYEGGASLYTVRNVLAWLPPAAALGAFLVLLMFSLLCLNAIIRRRWSEQEKLSYPLIQMPLLLTGPRERALSAPGLWIGFGVSGMITLCNGLHEFLPLLPTFRTGWDLRPMLTTRPWNALASYPAGGFYVVVEPFVVGLSYFSPLNLAFATWFFVLVAKAELVLRSALAIWATPGPFRSYPTAGAWLVLALYGMWASRRYFGAVLRAAWSGAEAQGADPICYRAAVLGAVLGGALLLAFLGYIGMSAWVATAFLGIYVLYAVAIARIRAEVGPPAHDAEFMGPEQILLSALGSRVVGAKNVALMSRFYWMSRAYRSHPIGHELEGLRMAESTGGRPRAFFVAIVIALVVGTVSGFWVFLHNAYYYGNAHMHHNLGGEAFARLSMWLRNPSMTDPGVIREAGIGAAITITLMLLHRRFVDFPFHPVGYAVASGAMINGVWFSILVSWAAKWSILRFGGIRQYRKMAPFFAGLVLGYAVLGCVTLIARVLAHAG